MQEQQLAATAACISSSSNLSQRTTLCKKHQRHNLHTAALLILCKRLHLALATHLGMRLPIAGAADLVHEATVSGDINSLQ